MTWSRDNNRTDSVHAYANTYVRTYVRTHEVSRFFRNFRTRSDPFGLIRTCIRMHSDTFESVWTFNLLSIFSNLFDFFLRQQRSIPVWNVRYRYRAFDTGIERSIPVSNVRYQYRTFGTGMERSIPVSNVRYRYLTFDTGIERIP